MAPTLDTPVLDALALIREDLAAVELELQGEGSPVGAIHDIGMHLQTSGGKRIRAALVLLAARLGGCEQRPRVRLAAIAEMIHAATLIHDDILDEAATRRGRPSANAVWGNSRCVLAGDWLYMQAFRLALGERSFAILDALIGLTQDMVEGELLQLEMQGTVVTAAQHMDLIERKTARLFQVSSQLGAMAAGRPEEEIVAMGRFGRHLGLAFQMVDDILDFTGNEATLGKPVGNDLREGKMTLAAIYANVGGDRLPEFAAVIAHPTALERARDEARHHAAQAGAALARFPRSPWRAALERLPEMVIERER